MSMQDQPDTVDRSYTEIQLGSCHIQTAEDRFGPKAHLAIEAREHPHGFNTSPFAAASELWPAHMPHRPQEVSTGDITCLVPSCAILRGNLTALSNVHNLYFAAYQDHIFVYQIPGTAAPSLPKHPNVKIECKPTAEGVNLRGVVDRQLGGRSLNHIITGFLGEEEILLACSDKGDVFAFYTEVIAHAVLDRAQKFKNSGPAAKSKSKNDEGARDKVFSGKCFEAPQPFFEANVGKSAWGLAIHKQSRLMAVSSNRWEITVFAPSLVDNPDKVDPQKLHRMPEAERRIRRRECNARIIIGMHASSHNMPNICFLDDERGFAVKVAGTDINGHAWVADIWKAQTPVRRALRNCADSLKTEELDGLQVDPSRGWGLMALQDHHFMKVDTFEELVGVPRGGTEVAFPVIGRDPSGALRNDLRDLLNHIPGNPCRPRDFPFATEAFDTSSISLPEDVKERNFFLEPDFPQAEKSWSESVGEAPGVMQQYPQRLEQQQIIQQQIAQQDPPSPETFASVESLLAVFESAEFGPLTTPPSAGGQTTIHNTGQDVFRRRLRRKLKPLKRCEEAVYYPCDGTLEEPTRYHVQRPPKHSHISHHSLMNWEDDDVASSYILLRTYERDLELTQATTRHANRLEINPYFSNALHCTNHMFEETGELFWGTSRVNMLFHIPELCIAVLGSPTGRVIVATLTKLQRPKVGRKEFWGRSMRIEWILPLENDEYKCRHPLIEARPLHGLAVGRIPGAAAGDATSPQRWRIMMHYRNHLMLSYEITRKEQTGKVCIF